MTRPIVFAFNSSGAETARRVARAVGGETCGLDGRVTGLDSTFDDAASAVAEAFRAGRPILGVCAAGILIRLIAPLLVDKRAEPPVLAVSDDGAVVAPLIGGLVGADTLARTV
ncbi:precorrin-3B C(17)-methyltransferase, partial [Methylopila musalis]